MSDRDDPCRYDAIARLGGGFAMIAIDARESMRRIFRDAGLPHEDTDLRAFKEAVARALGGLASAVLCDPLYGTSAVNVMRSQHPQTGLIIAVDSFDEPRYGPLRESRLDEQAMRSVVDSGAVAALKLYLYWHPDRQPRARLDDARRFVDVCQELGVVSLLEGVVTHQLGDIPFDDALVEAAEAFGAIRPDVYKTQMPTFGHGTDADIEREARRVTDAAGVPWVVLSNGVDGARFPSALAAACRGGASGFLAGRGVWHAALRMKDPGAELASDGRGRLEQLIGVVDRYARPWWHSDRSR